MADVLLAVLVRPETARGVLRAAARLGELVGASRINVLAVREPLAIPTLDPEAMDEEADEVLAAIGREVDRMSVLKLVFERWQADSAVSVARWVEAEGETVPVVGEFGSRADYVVVDRPNGSDGRTERTFHAALFATGRPVLMVPPEPGLGSGTRSAAKRRSQDAGCFGRRVAIAWRDDKQTARAVVSAIRCLGRAARVHVLSGLRDRREAPLMPRVLMEHGVPAVLHVLPIGSEPLGREPFGKTLLAEAHRVGADLLVMGAYVHSPLREMILGGVTRYMAAHADLPVLMRH